MSGIKVPDILYFYRTEIKQERDLVDLLKVIFPYTAQRAYPIIWNVFECSSRSDTTFRISLFRVVNPITNFANVFIHN